ncbi:peptide deformylase [Desulfoglaeba alkanexedens]|jgi:peptide deformylase|uniref:Peptide deformylase n=1 Tax=Desulfoglaeba alkanexedens ALDC TaxID=980445 RepID=A0A4P8L2V4_9BACT|nr:peptide deformylase [Desulfoglaeba alkanexedens]QCQ22256.1 peptide deformylase [Desulfoglaeba alkanexedens ALDC]
MALLEIRVYPDKVLREKARPIDTVDRSVRRLINNMAETMYDAPGIGLAANQVGEALRVILVDLQREDDDHGLITLVNPEIVKAEGEVVWEEGCLSVPDYFSPVKRFETVTVRGRDPDGNPREIHASGLLAVALQHEIDHLEGRLFIDLLNPIKRDMFKRRWKKRLKEAQG